MIAMREASKTGRNNATPLIISGKLPSFWLHRGDQRLIIYRIDFQDGRLVEHAGQFLSLAFLRVGGTKTKEASSSALEGG